MNMLDRLETLCKSSYSQSSVHIEIHELLSLIEVAREAQHHAFLLSSYEAAEGYRNALAALEETE